MDPIESSIIYVAVMFSAMMPGVYLGSSLTDSFGGYKGRGMRTALSFCIIFAVMSSIFSIWLSYTFDPTCFVILLWLFFFFGAGIMPAGNGIIVGCVPKHVSNSASALYCVCQNMIGLSFGTVISGYIMDGYRNKREGMIHGYRVLMYAPLITTLLLIIARMIVKRALKTLKKR